MTFLKPFIVTLLALLHLEFACGFKAAVFEHAEQSHLKSGSPREIIRANLEYYERAAKVAKAKGAQIIVFPEYGIFPPSNREVLKNYLEYIPNPKTQRINPCEEYDQYSGRPILYTLSCIARTNGIILVANMGDIQTCKGQKDCPKDGHFNYNTNVAFYRDGTVLGKYHKEHLFEETGMDLPTEEQDPTFETEFGRFAMFVCFDIVFRRIAEVAHWKGVDVVLLPTMWINNSPLFNSIQYFESWAIGNNVTLLAANIHLPGTSSLGSVIVNGRNGAKVYTFNPDGHSKLLVADISSQRKDQNDSSITIFLRNGSKEWNDDGKDVEDICSLKILKPPKDMYKDYRCLEREIGNFTLAKLVRPSGHIEACNNGMCCSLDYLAKDMSENYYLGVYNGSYNALNRYFWAEENCFMARCDDLNGNNCVTFPMRSKTIFYKVLLKANFSTKFIYPSVMSSRMRLLKADQWEYKISSQAASIAISNDCGKDLLIVGFKGRAYNRDPPFRR